MPGKQAVDIPVLCYHRFGQFAASDPYFVTEEEFQRQLAIIQQEGFTPVTASQLLAGLDGGRALPAKPVLITVDDGYRDFWEIARPLLRAYGYPATLFVYPRFIGARKGLTREQLRTLQQEGFEIGSHSATHPKLTRRARGESAEKRKARLRRELAGSRDTLRAWTGGEVAALAYPYGLWDTEIADEARAAGYRLLFTVNPGTNTPDTPRERWKRDMILHGTRDETFRELLRVKPLACEDYSPRPGARVTGPLEKIQVTLAPEARARILPESLTAARGATPLRVDYRTETGRLELGLPRPWTQGTDLVVLKARGAKAGERYEESWLMTVDPPQGKEEL